MRSVLSCNEPVWSVANRTHSSRGGIVVAAPIDRFVPSRKGKALLKGTGSVALLKREWAESNNIRVGKTSKGVDVFSVNDLIAYKARVDQEQQDDALASKDVTFWRTVVDYAVIDKNSVVESWANDHLMVAIAESDTDILGVGDITFD